MCSVSQSSLSHEMIGDEGISAQGMPREYSRLGNSACRNPVSVQDILEQLKCAKMTTGKSWPSPGKVPGDGARRTATRFQQVPDAVHLEMAVLSTWEIGQLFGYISYIIKVHNRRMDFAFQKGLIHKSSRKRRSLVNQVIS